MKWSILLIFISINIFAAGIPQYYISCHKKLEQEFKLELAEQEFEKKHQELITCQQRQEISVGNLNQLLQTLNLSRLALYQVREADKQYRNFLEECSKEKAQLDADLGQLAALAYDISFINRTHPEIAREENNIPKNYIVKKYYGQNPETCYQSGLKAMQLESKDGKSIIFSITGTEARKTYSNGTLRETYLSSGGGTLNTLGAIIGKAQAQNQVISAEDKDKEDWGLLSGTKQIRTICAAQMVQDAVEAAQTSGKKIIFTGHSLGGALAQGLAYRTQARLMLEGNQTSVKCTTFMAAGGRGHVASGIDKTVLDKIDGVSYTSLGDIVPTFGEHIGEMREMKRTDVVEEEIINHERNVSDIHSMNLASFESLDQSVYITGQELFERNQQYSSDYLQLSSKK